jgi:hypothetical protein
MTQPKYITVSEAVFHAAWGEVCRTSEGRSEYYRQFKDYLFTDREWPPELYSQLPPNFPVLTQAEIKNRQRRPSIGRMVAAAERSGKNVTSITTPDGVTLHFDKVENTEASNPWFSGIDDETKQ